jgi:hypothetical protein
MGIWPGAAPRASPENLDDPPPRALCRSTHSLDRFLGSPLLFILALHRFVQKNTFPPVFLPCPHVRHGIVTNFSVPRELFADRLLSRSASDTQKSSSCMHVFGFVFLFIPNILRFIPNH